MAVGRVNVGGGGYRKDDIIPLEKIKIDGEFGYEHIVAPYQYKNFTLVNGQYEKFFIEHSKMVNGSSGGYDVYKHTITKYNLNGAMIESRVIDGFTEAFDLFGEFIYKGYAYFSSDSWSTMCRVNVNNLMATVDDTSSNAPNWSRGIFVANGDVYDCRTTHAGSNATNTYAVYRKFGTSKWTKFYNGQAVIVESNMSYDNNALYFISRGTSGLKDDRRLRAMDHNFGEIYSIKVSDKLSSPRLLATNDYLYIYYEQQGEVYKHSKATGQQVSSIMHESIGHIIGMYDVKDNIFIFTKSNFKVYNAQDELLSKWEYPSYRAEKVNKVNDKVFIVLDGDGKKRIISEMYKHIESIIII